ncbi:MAG: beta strand repeat-containing protein [Planctomycetota bacterium]
MSATASLAGESTRLFMAAAAVLALARVSSAVDVTTLYTQTGTDATWQQLLDSNAIPVGTTSTAGVTGSVINVNNTLVEVGPNKANPIISGLRIHTLGNSSVLRGSFSKWSRWYQEDGTTQVFRLFKDEVNVQNDRPNAARIESFHPDIDWAAGEGWFKWQGTYTIIKPIGGAVFQAKNSDNDWAVMINTNGNGDVTLNHRTGTDKVLATNMVGQPFDITVYDNGTNYMVYMNDQHAGNGSFSRPTGLTEFRWGMYVGDSVPARDAMLFVTGAKISSNVTAPPTLSATLAAPPSRVVQGAAVSGTLSVSNSTPATSSTGAARLDYRYSSSGLFTGSGTGSDMALGTASTHLIPVQTGSVGLFTGVVSATATSAETATPTFSQSMSMSVLDHAIGSFASGSTLATIDIDFGTLTQGTGTASRGVSIFNRAGSLGSAWTAKLDLDGITADAPGVFSTTLAPFVNLASGSSQSFSLSMLTSATGMFSGTYSLNLSDENLPGATSQAMSLTVRGIVAPSPSSTAWTSSAGGSWVTGSNWSAGVPNSPTSVATVGSAFTGPAIITLDAPITLNVLSYAGATGTIATGSGGSLTFGGTAATVVVPGSLAITAPVSGGFVKHGAGVLSLTGSGASGGAFTIASGTLDVTNASFARPGRGYSVGAGTVLSVSGTSIVYLGTTGTTTISGDGVMRVSAGTTLANPNKTGQGDVVMQLGPAAALEVNGLMGGGWSAGRGVIDWTNNESDLVVGPAGRFDVQLAPRVVVDALLGSGSIAKTGTGATVLTCGVADGSGTFLGTISNVFGTISLQKTGTGTQVLASANLHTGSTTIEAGTLVAGHPRALANSRVTVRPGATFAVGDGIRSESIGLALDGGLVDIRTGQLVILPGGITEATLVAGLAAGSNGGGWDGASGITSAAVRDATAAGIPRSVGWLAGSDGSFTLACGAAGDTNLDGVVDVLDVADLMNGLQAPAGDGATWATGDFNYDGIVDVLDLADFAGTGLFNAGPYAMPEAPMASLSLRAALPAAVPEPAIGAGLLVAVASALPRRRQARPSRSSQRA